jgi:hypothetical protein
MMLSRRIFATLALASYLVMGALLYLRVLPGADGLWPPDFHLRGYDALSIEPFVSTLREEGRATYSAILNSWDRVFIVSLAIWLALMGWRGNGIRYVVVGLAVIYGLVDLAENAAIYHFVNVASLDAKVVSAASHLTMAKFASLYLCVLVLIVHMRRTG